MPESKKLDCSGLVCPMPVAKTKKELSQMNPKDILEIEGDFPEAGENIQRYVETHGDKVLEFKTQGKTYYLKIEKQ